VGLFVRTRPARSEWIGCAVGKFCHAFGVFLEALTTVGKWSL
jgi:hypothetical protein